MENTISEISADEIVLNTIEIGTRSPTAHIFQIEEIPPNSSDQQTPKKRKAVNMTTNEVVMEELETQKKLCSEISNAISVMKEHNGETQNGIRKLRRSMDRLGDIQKDQLKEQKRHNAKMEEFRKAELENKIENDRKLLELEKRKVEIMQQGEFIYMDV